MKKIKLVVDRYIGIFYIMNARGQWRHFEHVGNAGVAEQIASMLRRLGHEVQIEDADMGDDL
jgi:hypothetical protein